MVVLAGLVKMWSLVLLLCGAEALGPTCASKPVSVERRAWLAGSSRRAWLAGAGLAAWPLAASAKDWRSFTALAPLGPESARVGGAKDTGFTVSELAEKLVHDATLGASGKGGYLVSGDMPFDIFADDCRFVDETNDVRSLAKYSKALNILFDPTQSNVALVSGPEIDGKRISATLRSSGVLKLPWRPRIREYDAQVVWTIGESGLVVEQAQVWSISAAEALRQTFTPGALA
ncbi:hypothetical protein M885DRAFT_519842 [Pelagophyceae sp. CCMP2097]|nr:hypothetical protein M885DRAFT_519842 [Pelagophyceae sp. CCMP2097]